MARHWDTEAANNEHNRNYVILENTNFLINLFFIER